MILKINNLFSTYLQIGFEHISDLNAYDHIVFVVALCAVYQLKEWKKILVLVTAFTLGHSVTLFLSIMDIIRFSPTVIELLIPVTILITVLHNITLNPSQPESKSRLSFSYILAFGFGLIHGMGFSNFLRATMMPAEQGTFWQQLLAFNIGIELGQLLIVACVFALGYLVTQVLKYSHYAWNLFVSGIAFGIAMVLLLDQL